MKNESIGLFRGKLKEKKQNDQQRKQVFHTLSLYYELGLIDSEKDGLFKDKNQNLSIKKEAVKISGHSDVRTTMIYTHPNERLHRRDVVPDLISLPHRRLAADGGELKNPAVRRWRDRESSK